MSTSNAVPANAPQKEKPRGAASRLVRAKVAAAETGVPYTSLRDLAFRGEIPVIKVGKAWYFDRRDLENWIATRKERLKQ
jgi:excisionase family DNA binding protein